MFHRTCFGALGNALPSDLDGFVPEPGDDPMKFNFDHDDFVVDFDDNGDGYEGCAAEAWEEFVSRAVEATSAAEAATVEWREDVRDHAGY